MNGFFCFDSGQPSGGVPDRQPPAVERQPLAVCRNHGQLAVNCGRRLMCLLFPSDKLQTGMLLEDLKFCRVYCPGCVLLADLRISGVSYSVTRFFHLKDSRGTTSRGCPNASTTPHSIMSGNSGGLGCALYVRASCDHWVC